MILIAVLCADWLDWYWWSRSGSYWDPENTKVLRNRTVVELYDGEVAFMGFTTDDTLDRVNGYRFAGVIETDMFGRQAHTFPLRHERACQLRDLVRMQVRS